MFYINKVRAYGWRVVGTETYHSEKTGKDYVSAVFIDSDGYRKTARIGDGVDPSIVEAAKDGTYDVCISAIARKDYSFLVFEGFYKPETGAAV